MAFAFILLTACGKSIDKNSFEGRVASVISDFQGVNMALSMDLKSIIQKSGIRDGAIPKQQLATIKPYLDALSKSINMEKQVFMLPLLNYNGQTEPGGVVLFDVKDVKRMKKEFKEMGINLSKKGELEYGTRETMVAGIFKNQTGFIVMTNDTKDSEKMLTSFSKSLDAGKTVDGVVDFVNMKADMTFYVTGDKPQNIADSGMPEIDKLSKKMAEISKGTYWMGEMNFNNQEAVMTFDVTYGDNMEQYMPLVNDEISAEAKAVVADPNTIGAYAMSMKFDKFIDMIVSNLDEKTKEEVNKSLSMVGGLEQFKRMLTGEMAVAVTKADSTVQANAFIGIGDKKQVKTLIDGFGFFLGLEKSGDGYKMQENYLQFTDKGLLFAMSKEHLKKMKAGKIAKTRSLGDFKFGEAPFSMFMDIRMMSKMIGMEDFTESFKDFDYMTYEMTANSGKMVIKSTKANQNILRTLVEGFEEMQLRELKRQEEEQRAFEEMWGDEASIDEPTVEDYNF